ncbi:MAG: type II toxin-antitoxin system Phd/YefM family antitoxin [Elusimicrobia bacterium]|nr:type II toxin-antitoxin system Phd/YefM family antitoxin [Elusimicrobiota bacterium]
MNASVVDLRYKTREIFRALDRQENVNIFFHGKLKGVISPRRESSRKRPSETPLFGMYKKDRRPVSEIMDELRGGRFRDL